MRTNIEIDDKLMKDALKATGAKTKREAVELGLKTRGDRSHGLISRSGMRGTLPAAKAERSTSR